MRYVLPVVIILLLAAPVQAGPELAERELTAKLQKQLDALVGPGKAHISVSGTSEDGYQTRSRSYSKQQPASEKRVTETRTDSKTGSVSETHTTTRTKTQSDYTFNQTEELRSHAPVGLKQKSVSVIFEPPEASEEGEASRHVDPKLVEDVVRSAAGIDESRGDRLDVHEARMDTSAYDKLKDEMEKQHRGTPWWIFALVGGFGIVSGAGVGLLLRRRRRQPEPQPEWQATGYAVQPMPMAQNPALNQGNPLNADPQGPVVQIQPQQR